MKKLVWVLCIVLLSEMIASEQYSKDREDYYFDGKYYLTDGIEPKDITINGLAAQRGNSIYNFGWVLEGDGGCAYSEAEKSLGKLSIECTSGADHVVRISDEDFHGSLGAKIYIPCEEGSTLAGLKTFDYSGKGIWLLYKEDTSRDFWSVNDAGYLPCDVTSIPFTCNKWNDIVLEYVSEDTVNGYINGQLCHVFTDRKGLGTFISMANHLGGTAYFDEFWIAESERPLRGRFGKLKEVFLSWFN